MEKKNSCRRQILSITLTCTKLHLIDECQERQKLIEISSNQQKKQAVIVLNKNGVLQHYYYCYYYYHYYYHHCYY